MPVIDIQLWADDLEDVRIPAIESDISGNTSEINARAQELSDALAANVAATTSAQQTANLADSLATNTFNQFVALEVALKAYADASAQAVRNDFQLTIDTNNAAWQSNVQTNLQAVIDAALPDLVAENNTTISEIESLRSSITTIAGSYDVAVADLVNITLPALATDLTTAQTGVDSVTDDLTLFIGNYGYTTLSEGLDAIRADNEANLVPLGVSTLREPKTLWGKDIESGSGMIRSTLGVYGTFPVDDVDFGECFNFADNTVTSIGIAYPVDFSTGRVYKITARAKAVDHGTTNGVNAHVGVVAAKGGTNLFSSSVPFVPNKLTIAGGPEERSFYVCTTSTSMSTYGIAAADYVVLTGSEEATKLYAYVGQNAGGATDGIMRVGSIEITDVTEVLAGVNAVNTSLTASIDGVSTLLQQDYYTAVDADTAMAGLITTVKNEIEDPNGSSLGSTLQTSYYTKSATDSEISNSIASYNLNLNSVFSAVENEVDALNSSVGTIQANYVSTATLTSDYYTKVAADTAISQEITNYTVSFEGQSVDIATIAQALDGVRGEYGVVVNNNGVLSGTKLISEIVDGGGVLSTFKVQADKFMVVSPGNTTGAGAKQVFTVSDSYIYMGTDVRINGSLFVGGSVPKTALDTATQNEVDDGVAGLALASQANSTANAAASDVAAKPETYRQSLAPDNPVIGDIWIDTTTNKIRRWGNGAWQSAAIEAESVVAGWAYLGVLTANQVNAVAINANSVTVGELDAARIKLNGSYLENDGTGNIRIKSNAITNNEIAPDAVDTTQLTNTIVADIGKGVQAEIDAAAAQGTANTAVTNAGTAQTAADLAQSTANVKARVYRQASEPAGQTIGDMWIHNTTGVTKFFTGATWIGAEIQAETVAATWVYANTLTADQVNAVAINANSISVGDLSADRLTLNGTKLTSVSGVLTIAGSAVTETELGNAAVTTVKVDDDAVSEPMGTHTGGTVNYTSMSGGWVVAAQKAIDVTNVNEVTINWFMEQGYVGGSTGKWKYRIRRGGTAIKSREAFMFLPLDQAAGSFVDATPGTGTVTYYLEWGTDDVNDNHTCIGTINIFGRKK